MHTRPLLLLTLLLLSRPTLAPASSRLAVMDLRPQEGVTLAEARTLTGLLRTALHQTGAFTLINREDLEEIARNYQIELTVCEEDACLLKLGTLVGAQLLVTGDVGRVFDDFVINLRLVDLAGDTLTNRIITSEVAQGNALSFQGAMTRAAQTLAGMPESEVEGVRRRSEAEAQGRSPGASQPRKRRFTARAGFSPLTGIVGLEYRHGHVGVGAGYVFGNGSGAEAGVRYSFNPSGPSWFVALGGFRTSSRPQNGRNVTWQVGVCGGRQWLLGRSLDLAAGAGIGRIWRTQQWIDGTGSDFTDHNDGTVFSGELSLGLGL